MFRRGLTKALWWYGLPQWGQVSDYQHAVASVIDILLADQNRLRARIAALEEQLAALEGRGEAEAVTDARARVTWQSRWGLPLGYAIHSEEMALTLLARGADLSFRPTPWPRTSHIADPASRSSPSALLTPTPRR